MAPDMRLERGTGNEVDRSAHRRSQRILERDEPRQPDRPLELDEHVDIAVGIGVAARDRAEDAERADRPASPKIGKRFAQRGQYLLAIGHAGIPITWSGPACVGSTRA